MVNLSLSYGMEDPRMSFAFFFFGFAVVAGGGESREGGAFGSSVFFHASANSEVQKIPQ